MSKHKMIVSGVCAPVKRFGISGPERAGQKGFSIMEALVAMALIAGAFLPLLVLQSQLIRTALAVERAEENLRVEANALALLKTVNPSLRPTGQEPLGNDVVLRWASQPLSTPTPARGNSGESGRFDIVLYDLSAEITLANGRTTGFTIRQVGWIATRPAGEF